MPLLLCRQLSHREATIQGADKVYIYQKCWTPVHSGQVPVPCRSIILVQGWGIIKSNPLIITKRRSKESDEVCKYQKRWTPVRSGQVPVPCRSIILVQGVGIIKGNPLNHVVVSSFRTSASVMSVYNGGERSTPQIPKIRQSIPDKCLYSVMYK